jgi:hypothetical protein
MLPGIVVPDHYLRGEFLLHYLHGPQLSLHAYTLGVRPLFQHPFAVPLGPLRSSTTTR